MTDRYIKHNISVLFNVTKIVTIHYYEFDKKFEYSGEKHDFWEMVYVDKGEIDLTAGSRDITLKQGEAYFHKPNEFHRLRANGVNVPNLFVISFVCNSKTMDFFKDKKIKIPSMDRRYIFSIIEEANQTYENLFNTINMKELKTLSEPKIGGQQMIRNYLEQFLITILRNDLKSSANQKNHVFRSTENRIIPDITRILEQNVYGKVSVSDICKKMNYSKAYISRVFLETTGYSIGRYYMELKINEAKKMIREQKYNFAQISDMLSFSEPQYFSRVFKRIVKMTPTQYSQSVGKYSIEK